jgi:multiple sugar transport system permease protein
MYPMPVERWKPLNRRLYKASLPVALLIWLLPMLAVLVTSVRSSDELAQGDYWGWPKHFALIENYGTALTQTPMLHYFANSVLITVPSVIGVDRAGVDGRALRWRPTAFRAIPPCCSRSLPAISCLCRS